MAVAVLLGAILCWRFLAFARMPVDADTALRAAPWAASAAIAAHSAFDFNLQVPANAFLAAVVAGLAVATSREPSVARPASQPAKAPVATVFRGVLPVVTVAAFAFMVRDAFSDAAIREMRWALVGDKVGAIPPADAAAAQRMETALAAGERAYRYDPSNAQLALLNGRLNLHLSTAESSPKARRDRIADSKAWAVKAARNCPVCRGLPEPVVPTPPKPR
jgi:hypothetical protein